MKISDFLKLAVSIGSPFLAGFVGSIFTVSAIPLWYQDLLKPSLNPPAWVFGPVWTILFVLMGISAFLVWRAGWQKREVRVALGLFGIQLVFNAFWSVIFFGLKSPGWAFADIIVLLFFVIWTAIAFFKISKTAGYIFLPYILWISFATYLNLSIWVLN